MSNLVEKKSNDEKASSVRGGLFSRLAADGSISLFGEFSGQGRPWLSGLREVYTWSRESPQAQNASGQALRGLIERATETINKLVDEEEIQMSGQFKQGFDIMKWMLEPETAPKESYMANAPLSYPMIYLSELCNFFQFCVMIGKDIPEVASWFKVGGLTGHSQGVVCAVVVALAKTQQQFVERTLQFLIYMFYHGVRVQQVYPNKVLPSKVLRDAPSPPTPMLSVTGLPYTILSKFIEKTNSTFGASSVTRKVYLSLINGMDVCSVTGHPYSLVNLQNMLKTIQADANENQDRIPFSKRKVKFHMNFIPVSVPFHCPLLEGAVEKILKDLEDKPELKSLLEIKKEDLNEIPVWCTNDNSLLGGAPTDSKKPAPKSIMHALVTMQTIEPVHWGLTCRKLVELGVTHVLDFSRGGASNSLGRLTHRNLDGTGIQVLLGACEESDDNTVTVVKNEQGQEVTQGDSLNIMNVKGRSSWLDLSEKVDPSVFPLGVSWSETYGPKLLKLNDGRVALRTKYTDLFNRPPLFVSGMTPSTAEEVLCSAVINAGYSIELAGGGQHTPQLFRQRITEIAARTPPGEGIHVNLLYLNPFLFNMQFPLALAMKKEDGLNIDCITMAAGVPGPEKADELCQQLLDAGINKLGFKPGTTNAIAQVVEIAARNPKMNIILQWTGGRSGGHHSMEDAHIPLVQSYALIRTQPNIILVMGGGLGDAASAYPYLSGTWALPYFKPPMPLDGLLFGSRIMVALEAPTDPRVKELIVKTPGVTNEKEWEQSLTGVAGGVVTVQSELGEPIHKIATRGILFWKEMDEKFFTITNKDQLKSALAKNKNYIISKLNEDFQKPYFGRKKDGLVVDLPQMTYEEVTIRLLDFFHPKQSAADALKFPNPWIDITYFMKFKLWVTQIVARFSGNEFTQQQSEEFDAILQFKEPVDKVLTFLSKNYPEYTTELLSPEDEDFFLGSVCMMPGKPVNFVPLIDENLKIWLKKDSLWFSEDLRSIPNQDVQRCAILQSPVSARFSEKANESVKEIMDGIHTGLVELLKKEPDASHNEEFQVKEDESIGTQGWTEKMNELKEKFATVTDGTILSLAIPSSISTADLSKIDLESWQNLFASVGAFWTRSLFNSSVILRTKKSVLNYLRALFVPRKGIRVNLYQNKIQLFDNELLGPQSGPAVELVYDDKSKTLELFLANPSVLSLKAYASAAPVVKLNLKFTLVKGTFQYRSYGLLLEQSWESKVAAITSFYRSLWLTPGDASASSASAPAAAATRQITASEVTRFIAATSDESTHETSDGKTLLVPLDYSIVLAWTDIVRAMIDAAESIRGDLLSLVHLSNEYDLNVETSPLLVGDNIRTDAKVTGLWIEPEGQVITVQARVYRAASANAPEQLSVTIVSRFAIRPSTGSEPIPSSSPTWFRNTEANYRFSALNNPSELAILLDKKWHDLTEKKLNDVLAAAALTPAVSNQQLVLKFTIHETAKQMETLGSILYGETEIAKISNVIVQNPSISACPVLAYAKRKCVSSDASPTLTYEQPQNYASSIIVAPASNKSYAIASKDCNVIHLNPYVTPLASLPTTITHGMYSSSKMRQAMSEASGVAGVLHGQSRVLNFKAEFKGMVYPGAALKCSLQLIGMQDGLKQVVGELRTIDTDSLVLKATGRIQQSPIAYLFTGQGSAQINMGMELYGTSVAAKAVWDGAERFLQDTYGFSILDIVKNNPKSLTIQFQTDAKGLEMKRKYLGLGLLKLPVLPGEEAASSSSPRSSALARAAAATPAELASLPESYTFSSSEGLLFQTQFQQPSILLQETAAYVDLKQRGVIQPQAKLSGHSLGEYCCLAACLESSQVSSLAEVVFLRGLTMQNAVKRDELNRSRYGMVAASPDRVGAFFTESQLLALVLALESETNELLQVVNFNVYNSQYVIAGGLVALEALRLALDAIKKLSRKPEGSDLAGIVLAAGADARKKLGEKKDGFLPLTRGQASIPLTGIDVPFHSKLLMPGVPSFRSVLLNTFSRFPVRAKELVGKYIPNVLGQTFNLSKSYLQSIVTATGSEIVQKLVDDYDEAMKKPDDLCRALVVELLSFQFASPVQWIKTQDVLLKAGISRFIEVGPQPTLAPMLKRSTLDVGLEYLWIGSDLATICYEQEGVEEEAATAFKQTAPVLPSTTAPPPPVIAAPVAVAAPVARPSGGAPATSIPLTALHAIKIITAIKLKLNFGEIDASKSLKVLAGGKSALQNEVLGDIANEFKSEPEGAADLSLTDLAGKVGGGYAGPGKVLQGMATKNLALALPGTWNKSKAASWLSDMYGLDAPSAEAVLTHALLHKRDARLDNEAAGQAWMTEVAQAYASANGKSLSSAAVSSGAAAGGAAAGAPVAVVDAKEITNLKLLFKDQIDLLSHYLGAPSTVPQLFVPSDNVEADYLKHLESELDVKFLQGLVPIFEPKKIRSYDAAWNWVKTDVLKYGLHLADTSSAALAKLSPEELFSLENRVTPEFLEYISENKALTERFSRFVSHPSKYRELRQPLVSSTEITKEGKMILKNRPRYEQGGFEAYVKDMTAPNNARRLTLTKGTARSDESVAPKYAETFKAALDDLAKNGVSFQNKIALLTGCGAGSIGLEVVKCLLQGGAQVIVTTSQPTRSRYELFRRTYQQYGGKGSSLKVIPFNGASKQDCQALINEVGIPHFLFPFAALSENGRDISGIDGLAELAHRTMLTNVVRLLGSIKSAVPNQKNPNQYCHALLPLSPNHGLFGFDGLYAESKIGLETLYFKSISEGWNTRIGLIGAEIGWTKGTGLMSSNDLISEGIEKESGVRTFDSAEMAFNLVALCTPPLVELAKTTPIHADLSGGFASSKGGLPAGRIRAELTKKADIQRAVYTDALIDQQQASAKKPVPKIEPRAHLKLEFPVLPEVAKKTNQFEGMFDLTRVPVIVGFGEVGPWGSAITRWEAEVSEQFTSAGAIQLARSMGLIKYLSGKLPNGKPHIGWVDVATNEPLADNSIATKYAKVFSTQCGIRPVNPALFKGYEPAKKTLLQQMSLAAELKPFEVSSQVEAEHLKTFHGGKLEVYREGEKLMARLKDGATIYLPKTIAFDRTVAGQLPTGWDASKYLPKDILTQVDPVSVYALAATMDALSSAGLTDPYELYKHVHVSEVGNTIGSGMGGMVSMQGIFRGRYIDAQGLASDQLQESFVNTTAAWVNMLLLSSCGPVATPVAACATAAVSLELGVNAIKTGRAKVMFVGGTEDFCEEGSFEFAQMGATSSGVAEEAQAREPNEACRPCTSTRQGFMESQGSGVQILTSAALALEMGLPIYAIVAGVSTATDRQGRSIPAPGVGILSTAREASNSERVSPLLNLNYRRRQLERELASIDQWLDEESTIEDADLEFLQAESERRIAAAKRAFSTELFDNRTEVAPLRGALAVWGLTPDDLEAVSFHGTSTQANDKNESNVVQMQLEHLGRTRSKPIPVIAQKWLTGHPKGSAFGWMLNGLIQSMNTGIIPGNRNLDNPDSYLRKFDRLVYLDRSTNVYGRPLRAAYAHSFGFGQAGAEAIIVHADTLFSAVSPNDFQSYAAKRDSRYAVANRVWLEWMTGRRSLIPLKDSAPFADADMHAIFLSPLARATKQENGEYRITSASGPTKGNSSSSAVGGDKSKLNIALKQMSKSISFKSLSKSASRSSMSQFLHVDSRGEILNSPSTLTSPGSGLSAGSDGQVQRGMRRIDSSASFFNQQPNNQNLNTEVPSTSGGDLSRVGTEAALNSIGMTHSLSGLNLTSASLEADSASGVGVDVEEISEFASRDDAFFARNFTQREIDYCRAQPNPSASFAGKWAAKEAVLKALSQLYTSSGNLMGSGLQGAGAALIDIEIMAPTSTVPGQSLAPQVALKGAAEKLHRYLNLASIQLSISHAGSHALSLAMARAHPTPASSSSSSTARMQSARSIADMTKILGSSGSK